MNTISESKGMGLGAPAPTCPHLQSPLPPAPLHSRLHLPCISLWHHKLPAILFCIKSSQKAIITVYHNTGRVLSFNFSQSWHVMGYSVIAGWLSLGPYYTSLCCLSKHLLRNRNNILGDWEWRLTRVGSELQVDKLIINTLWLLQ